MGKRGGGRRQRFTGKGGGCWVGKRNTKRAKGQPESCVGARTHVLSSFSSLVFSGRLFACAPFILLLSFPPCDESRGWAGARLSFFVSLSSLLQLHRLLFGGDGGRRGAGYYIWGGERTQAVTQTSLASLPPPHPSPRRPFPLTRRAGRARAQCRRTPSPS